MTSIFRSRCFAVLLLIAGTGWDAGTTWLTVGNKLHLDGNPLIRNLNWTQLFLLMLLLQAAFVFAFWFAWERQAALWPDCGRSFWRFLGYRMNKGFALKFNPAHLKTETIYGGMLLMWLPVFGHFLSALITTCPLVGGPSFVDFFRLLGIDNGRTAQKLTTIFIVVASWILAHWPMYLSYRASQGDVSKAGRAQEA